MQKKRKLIHSYIIRHSNYQKIAVFGFNKYFYFKLFAYMIFIPEVIDICR